MSSLVLVEDRGSVRHIALNRPEKRNALNGALIASLRESFEEARDDGAVRCVVVRGEGPLFSSGADLFALKEVSDNPALLRPFRRALIEAWNILEEMTKPTICQIHGACIGAAMELAAACDLRTIAEGSVVGIPEVRIGLIPDVGGCSRLPALVGLGRAKELVMTGRLIGAEEAYRIGLANRTAAPGELDAVTQALADELTTAAPLAVGLAKRVLDMVAKPVLAATLEAEVTAQQALVGSADFAEGARAFVEKRPPEFVGE